MFIVKFTKEQNDPDHVIAWCIIVLSNRRTKKRTHQIIIARNGQTYTRTKKKQIEQ